MRCHRCWSLTVGQIVVEELLKLSVQIHAVWLAGLVVIAAHDSWLDLLCCRRPSYGAIKPATDQTGQGGDGLLRIGAVGHDIEHRAAPDGEDQEFEDALGVGRRPLGDDPDV